MFGKKYIKNENKTENNYEIHFANVKIKYHNYLHICCFNVNDNIFGEIWRKTEYTKIVSKDWSTKIVNFMTRETGVPVLVQGHINNMV